VWLLEGLGVLAAGIVILVAVLAIRLSQGPLPVNFLSPYIIEALKGLDPVIDVHLDETVLIWSDTADTLDVRARGVHVQGPNGEERATVPELSVSLSIPALFHGMLAPSGLSVYGLRVRLVRTADGKIQRGDAGPQEAQAPPAAGSGAPAPAPSASAQSSLSQDAAKALIAVFAGKPDANVRSSYLRRVSVADAEFILDDQKSGHVWRAPEAHLSIIRDRAGAEGRATLAVDLNGSHPRLDVSVRYRPGDTALAVAVDLGDLDPAAIATAVDEPIMAPLRGLEAPLTGKARAAIGLDGSLLTVGLTLDAGAGRIFYSRLGLGGDAAGLPLAGAHLAAHLSDSLDLLTVDRLDLDLDGAQLQLSGQVANLDAPVPTAHIEVRSASLPVPTLIRYWPEKALDHVHDWLAENLEAGTAEDVRIAADVGPAGPNGAPDVTSLDGAFRFKDISVAYFRPLPNASGVSGEARLTTDTLTFVVDGGRVVDLDIPEATVTITGLDVHDQDLAVEAVARGPLTTALGILDSPRLDFMKDLGIKPAEVSGDMATRVRLRIPLENKVALEQIDLLANANIRGAAVPGIALGLDVTDGAFSLAADRKGLALKGTAKIGGVDADVAVEDNFTGDSGFKRRVYFHGRLDDAARETIGVSLAPYVSGPTGIEAIVTQFDSHRAGVEIAADLTPSTITASDFGWSKDPEETAMAAVRATLRDDKLVSIDQLEVRGSDLFASGRVRFANDGREIESASLPKVSFGENDVRVNVSRNAAGAYVVQVGGAKINVEPLLNAGEDEGTKPGPPMIVDVAVGYARLGAGGGANGVSGHLERDDKHWHTMTIDGGLASAKPIAVRMRPDGNGRAFSVTAADAGTLLKALDITSNVRGGSLGLAGRYDDSDPRSPFKGKLEMRNFRLEGAPLVAKVLSVASLTGILNVLTGQGIDFSQFDATITFVNGGIYTDDLRSHGSALGFTGRGSVDLKKQTIDLQGTVVPAYSLNSVLGNIPLLGTILTGPQGGGVFAANYRMRGSLDDPEVTVNPLATLAPGILRNIFNIFDTPALTAPTPKAPASPPAAAPPGNSGTPAE
jgi:hypothetical protein